MEEAKKINKSLSALGMVINSLTDGKVSGDSHLSREYPDVRPVLAHSVSRLEAHSDTARYIACVFCISQPDTECTESLGGNSRTTLIINCSPATYTVSETRCTRRFGMRAKSIKNKARVNVEMSPAELKALLKKTIAELASVREHAACLEEEVKVWRNGGKVDKADWAAPIAQATSASASSGVRKSTSPIPPTPGGTSTPGSRVGTPSGLLPSAMDSRPDTPSTYGLGLDKDEKEDFLRRENELSDQLAEKVRHACEKRIGSSRCYQESALSSQEKVMADMKDEVAYLKEQEALVAKASPSF